MRSPVWGPAERSQALFPCRAGEGAFPEAQEGLHRESGGNPEPVEKHRGPVCELVSHKRDTERGGVRERLGRRGAGGENSGALLLPELDPELQPRGGLWPAQRALLFTKRPWVEP